MIKHPLPKSYKRADNLVCSLITEGYIIISSNISNQCASYFLRHTMNGNKMRIRATRKEYSAWKNGKLIYSEKVD